MSNLHDFCNHNTQHKPNDVHDIFEENLCAYRVAMMQGTVMPSLFYSPIRPFEDGYNVIESPHTVEKHVADREEFPYG